MLRCHAGCSPSEQERSWYTFSAPHSDTALAGTWMYQPRGLRLGSRCSDQLQGPFSKKGGDLRSSWIHVWVGARHPVSSGLCGLNECAVSIVHPFSSVKPAFSPAPLQRGSEGSCVRLFLFPPSAPTCHIHFSLTQPLLFIHCCCIPVTCKFPPGSSN